MLNKNSFLRYMIIDKALRNKPEVTLDFLIEYINERLSTPIEKRTVQLDIQAMRYNQELGFLAPIVFNRKTYTYEYSDKEYSLLKGIKRQMDLIPD